MESVSATILIVEDDQTTRRFLADNLAADGYHVAVTNGHDSQVEAGVGMRIRF